MVRRVSCFVLALAACSAYGQPQPISRPPAVHEVTSPQHTGPEASCKPGADWKDPRSGPPLRVYGNTWYVGTCGLTSLLVTSSAGHVLFDGGTVETASQIEANIRALGFRVEDVRFLLATHAHRDHVGGFAKLRADSGAVVVSRGSDAEAIERGHGARDDPQFLSTERFPPVAGVRRVGDGETLQLGELTLTAHATPGHTPGSTSWTWRSCEAASCRAIAYVDSVSAMSDNVYRYGDEAAHPGVVQAFRASLSRIAELPCDILLTPHPDASDMWLRLGTETSQALVDREACRRYAAEGHERLDERLAKERAPTP
ncbi:MAG TPA: subclass B3 metallo-beta-lactamase [Polyangiaceae bacterium]|jgi:metallo-beta-lactamase class B